MEKNIWNPYYLEYVELYMKKRTDYLLRFEVCKKMTCTAPAFLFLTVFCGDCTFYYIWDPWTTGLDRSLSCCLPGLFLGWRKQQV